MSDIDMPSYEIGYAEGGSSANADWSVVLSEFADIDAETPHEAVQKIKAAIRAAENDALERAALRITRGYNCYTAASVAQAEDCARVIRELKHVQ